MKEYLLTASSVYKGYWQDRRTRTEYTSGSPTAWSHTYYEHEDNDNNSIKYSLSRTETPITEKATSVVETEKRYRIAATFDLTGIDTTKVQSVKLRMVLTDRNSKSPLGYAVHAPATDHKLSAGTVLGNIDIGYPATPYEHDVTLTGLSPTGWYLLFNGSSTPYAQSENLTFDTANIVLVVTTDEEGGSTYKTSKVTLGAGTYTAYFPNSESNEMAMLLEPTGSGDNVYYSLESRQKIADSIIIP